MSDEEPRRISRRTLLKGLVGLSGAAAADVAFGRSNTVEAVLEVPVYTPDKEGVVWADILDRRCADTRTYGWSSDPGVYTLYKVNEGTKDQKIFFEDKGYRTGDGKIFSIRLSRSKAATVPQLGLVYSPEEGVKGVDANSKGPTGSFTSPFKDLSGAGYKAVVNIMKSKYDGQNYRVYADIDLTAQDSESFTLGVYYARIGHLVDPPSILEKKVNDSKVVEEVDKSGNGQRTYKLVDADGRVINPDVPDARKVFKDGQRAIMSDIYLTTVGERRYSPEITLITAKIIAAELIPLNGAVNKGVLAVPLCIQEDLHVRTIVFGDVGAEGAFWAGESNYLVLDEKPGTPTPMPVKEEVPVTRVVEKPVTRVVEVPVTRVVEKEVPVTRVVEKPVPQIVEKPVPVEPKFPSLRTLGIAASFITAVSGFLYTVTRKDKKS